MFRTSGARYPTDDTDPFNHNVDSLVLTMVPYVQSAIQEAGYSIMVDIFNALPKTPDIPPSSNHLFSKAIIDGAMFFGGMINEFQMDTIKSSHIPSVLVCSRDETIDFVDADSQEAMRLAVEYLVQHGHRQIALINGSVRSQVSARKLEGYQQGLAEYGLPFREELVEFTNFSGASAIQAMEKLSARNLHPTAIIGASDYIACAVLNYLRANNISCPQDISIIGYENTALSAYATPGITSVNIHKQQLGQEAAGVLLRRIKTPNARHTGLIIPPTLVVRDSVASI